MSTNFEMDLKIKDSRGARPGGHHCNIKWKMNDRNMQEGSSWLLNISDTETSARVLRNTWVYTGCVMEKKHIV